MEIYVLIDDKPQGPYTPELIRQYLASGQLQPTDLAAYPGRSDWKPLAVLVRSCCSAPSATKTGAAPANTPAVKASRQAALIAITAAGVVLLAGAGVFFLWKSHARTAVVATPADPTWPKSFAQLNTWYAEPPEGQNAATFFLKGFDAFQFSDADSKSADLPVMGQGILPAPGTPLSPRMKASVADLAQRNQSAWAQFKQGMSFERARYPIDLNQGPETLLPHLAKIKRTAQFAQLRAVLCAENKQSQDAVDSLLVPLAVADSLKGEPLIISQLVRVACYAIDTTSLQQVVNSVALSSSDLGQLSTAFSKTESADASGEGFNCAFVGERASVLALFNMPPDQLAKLLGNDPGGGLPRNLSANQILHDLKSQRAFAEETMNHALAMRKQPFPDRLKVGDYFDSRAAEAKIKKFYICQMLLPALGNATKREAAGLANLRLAETAIALERFRQANGGSYPDSLAALVPAFLPEVPGDPFKGVELHYQKSGDGYELQSTGQNASKPVSIKVVRPAK